MGVDGVGKSLAESLNLEFGAMQRRRRLEEGHCCLKVTAFSIFT